MLTDIAGQAAGAVVAQRRVLVGAGDEPHPVLDVLDDPGVLFDHRTYAHAAAGAGRGRGWKGGDSSDT